jgi:hypothetical protein
MKQISLEDISWSSLLDQVVEKAKVNGLKDPNRVVKASPAVKAAALKQLHRNRKHFAAQMSRKGK